MDSFHQGKSLVVSHFGQSHVLYLESSPDIFPTASDAQSSHRLWSQSLFTGTSMQTTYKYGRWDPLCILYVVQNKAGIRNVKN